MSFVYVIGAADETAPVKIGFTARTVEERLSEFNIGSPVPLNIIAAIRAPQEVEKNIHKLCREFRLHGEWFERKLPVRELIVDIMTEPDALLNAFLDSTKRPQWGPKEVYDCPASLAIWSELFKIGAPMREWAELYEYRDAA